MDESNPIQPQLSTPGKAKPSCDEWESLLPEALDGALSAKDLAAFEEHSQQCAACAEMLNEARQGTDWLMLLVAPLEPPPGLLDKILSRTSGKEQPRPLLRPRSSLSPGGPSRPMFPGMWQMLESRSLRTAAMAFFSLLLTLNLMDLKLSEVRLADLRPAVLQTQLSRQYYSANAQVIRYYENTRFVYEMEDLMRELKQSAAPDSPDSQRSPASRNGGASRGPSGLDFAAMEAVRRSTGNPFSGVAEEQFAQDRLIAAGSDDRDGASDAQTPAWAKGSAA